MSRLPSQDSLGTQSQRNTNSHDQSRSTKMYPSVSQSSYRMSSAVSDTTARSNSPDSVALYTQNQQIELHAFDNFPVYPGEEDFSTTQPIFHRGSNTSAPAGASLTTGSSYNMFPTAGDGSFVVGPTGSSTISAQGPVSQEPMMFSHGAIMDCPALWESTFECLESPGSSPQDPWSPTAPAMVSNANSPVDYSLSPEGHSPGYVEDFRDLVDFAPYTTAGNRVARKPIGPRPSKVASDLAAAASRRQGVPGSSEAADEAFRLAGRSSLEIDNTARDHHLYHNVTPQADGLYHCPWEKDPTSNCQHKPEKLKCNYDKFVDSHLKPYKCKVAACKELQFSSTACLLRHEREAHAMHGHGDKPFLCTYDGCERGVSGNGFPRHWNLRDHMKRVHNDPGQPKSPKSGSASPPPSGPTKGKKRKTGDNPDSPVAEKAPKRTATQAVVQRQPKEPSLVDRFHEKQKALADIVKQLSDPGQSDTITLLRSANECIKVMVQTSQRIQGVPVQGQTIKQQSS